MSDQNNPSEENTGPIASLSELKRRIERAQPVVVDQEGRLHTPDDPKVATKSIQEKTVLRPQRWFAPLG